VKKVSTVSWSKIHVTSAHSCFSLVGHALAELHHSYVRMSLPYCFTPPSMRSFALVDRRPGTGISFLLAAMNG